MKHLCLLFGCIIHVCFAVGQNFDLSEGSYCTQDAQNGTCVSVGRCADALRRIKIGERPQVCTFNGSEAIVCCTDCELIDSPSSIVLDNYGLVYYTKGRKAYDKCLQYMVTLPYPCQPLHGLIRSWRNDWQCHQYEEPVRIGAVGGEDAERDQYPHMALLGYGPSLEDQQWLCGGSVISEKYILTAGHCISSSLGPVAYVAMGILKRSDPVELWQRYKVSRIIPYPEYKSPSKYHDIALVEIEGQIKFNPSVLPACLDSGDTNTEWAYATGWGTLGKHHQLADTLQRVNLKRFSSVECGKQYPVHRHLLSGYDDASQMCYGDDRNIRDTCEGDSGGPLQVSSSLAPCVHVVIGVTSYGRSCGSLGNAGMYTRLAYYMRWIESIVWP